MNKVYYQIIRNFAETSEKDIYSENNRQYGWVDLSEVESCFDDRTGINFENLEEADKIYETVKNDKTKWTTSIILRKITENWETDEDGEENFVDENVEVLKEN